MADSTKSKQFKFFLVLSYGMVAIFFWANWPTSSLPREVKADKIKVYKSDYKMQLMSNGAIIKEYTISMGAVPNGHKQRRGDEKTPEGLYYLDWRNPYSIAFRSYHISYPNQRDKLRAQRKGVNPGGSIMIHGITNGFGWLGKFHRLLNWTDGCIAVTDSEMYQIWLHVPVGTAIEIFS